MSALEIPEHEILIPDSLANHIVDKDVEQVTGEQIQLTREKVIDLLPIKLGRGVPPFVNEGLIHLAATDFGFKRPSGFPTYAGEKATVEKNAFRGDKEYLDVITDSMTEEFGLSVKVQNIVSGSAGSQDLVTGILDYLMLIEGRQVATSELTFDRTNRHLSKRSKAMGKSVKVIELQANGEGIDPDQACEFFEDQEKKVLFLVPHGGNPDGSSISVTNLANICEAATMHGGVVVLDEAYARLYFNIERRESLTELQRYIDSETLIMIFTATKEGGHRGAAYAIGGKEIMKNILGDISDRRLCPNYSTQRQQAMLETYIEKDLAPLGDVLTWKHFLQEKIRPTLLLSFTTVKNILNEADIQLSTNNVTHGYNVAVYFPDKSTSEQHEEFFSTLKHYGVQSPDLSAFVVKSNKKGFRIPFGGFDADQCTLFSHLIVAAYQETFKA